MKKNRKGSCRGDTRGDYMTLTIVLILTAALAWLAANLLGNTMLVFLIAFAGGLMYPTLH